jgi:hypothetical protein
MGIIFLFVLVGAGAIGAVAGGIVGLGVGFNQTGALSLIHIFYGVAAGVAVGLLIGLIVVARALRDYWKSQDRHDGAAPRRNTPG